MKSDSIFLLLALVGIAYFMTKKVAATTTNYCIAPDGTRIPTQINSCPPGYTFEPGGAP